MHLLHFEITACCAPLPLRVTLTQQRTVTKIFSKPSFFGKLELEKFPARVFHCSESKGDLT